MAGEVETPAPTNWRLTWGEHSMTADDLNGADLGALAELLNNDWSQMDPTIGPLNLMAFLTVLILRSAPVEFSVARAAIRSAKASELGATLTFE